MGVFGRDRATRSATRHEKNVREIAVASDVRADHPVGAPAMLENGCARAVSEKHARIAIGPIRDRAQLFRADDKHGLVSMRGDELLPDFDSEQETGARRRDIEAGGILRADLLLHETRRCWEQHVGRSSCDQDQVDVFGRDFRLLERFQGSFRRHIARLLIFRRDPTFFNASARRDPFVARVDDLH